MSDIRVTVFTPTYNRARVLNRVYNSLVNQTYRSFRWLIIDDGSTDNTGAVAQAFIAEKKIPIIYVYQENQGKHIATNRAVAMTDTELFIIADSDDAFVPESLEKLVAAWDSIPVQDRMQYKGVICRCFDSSTKKPIGKFPAKTFDSNDLDGIFKLRLLFEKWMMFRTDVLREFPFPGEGMGLKFFPETVIWQQMGRKYKTRYIDDPLREYFRDQDDALTRTKPRFRENVFLWAHYINDTMEHFWDNPALFIKSFVGMCRDNILLGKSFRQIMQIPNRGWKKVVCAFWYPAGWLLSLKYRGRREQVRKTGDTVSVIIPVYNGEAWVEQCLRSVLGQSYANLQIIIVDDGSTDDTFSICERIAAQDSRICLVRQSNAGVSAARNCGISKAEGEYILFVDADDLLPPNAVSTLVEASVSGVDMVAGSFEEFRDLAVKQRIKKPETITKDDFQTDSLRVEKLVRMAWGKLYRTKIIHENNVRYDMALPFLEDTLFTWKYCKYVQSIRMIDSIVYRYRLGGVASTMKYYPERYKYLLTALTVYGDFYGGEDRIPEDFLKQKVSSGLMDCIMHYLTHCSAEEAQGRIGDTLNGYAPYLREKTVDTEMFPGKLAEDLIKGDAKAVVSGMWKHFRFRLVLKKLKKRLKNLIIRL